MTPTSDPDGLDWTPVLDRIAREPGLKPFLKVDAPLLVFHGAEARFVTGNAAGHALAAAGLHALATRKLAELAQGLAPLNGVRLERLALAKDQPPVISACRRLRLDETTTVLIVAAQERVAVEATAPVLSAPEPAVPEPVEAHAPPEPEAEAAAPPPPRVLPARMRFIWEIGADGLIGPVSGDVAELFGRTAAGMEGKPWQKLCGTLVHDINGAVAAALSGTRTWSGLPSLWRIDGSELAYRVILSGLPLTDSTRRPAGWRGFGIAETRERVPFPEAGPAEVEAPVVEPPTVSEDSSAEAATPNGEVPDETVMAEPVLAPDEQAIAHESAKDEAPPTPADPEQTEPAPAAASNVVQIRPLDAMARLSFSERNAFREIAKALGARIEGEEASPAPSAPPAPMAEPIAGTDEEPELDLELAPVRQPDDEPVAPTTVEPVDIRPTPIETRPLLAAEADDAASRLLPAPPVPDPTLMVERVLDVAPPAPTPVRDEAFEALLDKLPIGVLVLRAERVVYANRTLLDLLDHDDLDGLVRFGAARLFRGEAPSEGGGVFALTRADGGHEPVDARLSSITWQGQPATLISFRRSIETADPARLDALKLDVAKADAKARELTAILDTATDGVATMDERGRLLSLNRSGEALFGYDQREITGENFTLLLAPESHITALDYLEGLKGGGVASLLNDGREVQGRVRQGGRIPLFMTMGSVGQGSETIYSAVLRDMTAWKRAEADLVEAKRAAERASAQKSDVLAKISHEIRTPLNAIIGFTEVMSEERFGPIGNDRYKEYLSDIRQSGGYLISLVNDLLDLAKIEAGKMDLTFTGVSLNDIATSAVQLLQPEANRQRVVLRTGLQTKLPAVVADDRSLRQIVINVLSNAVKFTDAGGQVILSTALGDRGEVILRVRDTGVGMTEKELTLAMEPFRQVSATRRGNGTGLGLPITKALVEANKGQLAISSAKNEGTLVEITFPPQRVLAS